MRNITLIAAFLTGAASASLSIFAIYGTVAPAHAAADQNAAGLFSFAIGAGNDVWRLNTETGQLIFCLPAPALPSASACHEVQK